MMYDRSTNGGAAYGADRVAAPVQIVPAGPNRFSSLPAIDADRTAGRFRGSLYLAWADVRFGDADIVFSRSLDGGLTWSTPFRVNDDPLGTGAQQGFPAIVVDPRGRIVLNFFDWRRDPGGTRYEIWGAVSRDGGASFDTNFLVSDMTCDSTLNSLIGDYMGVAATSERLHPLWTDTRAATGETDIYTDSSPNSLAYDEVDGVSFLNANSLTWQAQDARFGQNLQYDIVSGLLSELLVDRTFDRATCLQNDVEDPPHSENRVLPSGDGFYHLIRASGPDGVGSYGDGSPARPNVRDPLDGSLPTCP